MTNIEQQLDDYRLLLVRISENVNQAELRKNCKLCLRHFQEPERISFGVYVEGGYVFVFNIKRLKAKTKLGVMEIVSFEKKQIQLHDPRFTENSAFEYGKLDRLVEL